ncbi:hypothetical protein HanHA300_Chr13g0483861 [Helianthus annuus]|nr:hypothetical protein HanHA300_Chr13g0483861 [Helianthus annuus]
MTKTYHISMVHVSIKYHNIVFLYKDCFVHCIKNKFKCSLIVKHVTPQKVVNIKRGLRVYSQNLHMLSDYPM